MIGVLMERAKFRPAGADTHIGRMPCEDWSYTATSPETSRVPGRALEQSLLKKSHQRVRRPDTWRPALYHGSAEQTSGCQVTLSQVRSDCSLLNYHYMCCFKDQETKANLI